MQNNPSSAFDDLIRLRGVGPVAANRLIKAGISSVEQIANSKPEELMFVKGFGTISANKLIKQAKGLITFEKGLSIVLDHIKNNFEKSCPKCGGEVIKRFLIINESTRMHVRQCKVCKFYMPAN